MSGQNAQHREKETLEEKVQKNICRAASKRPIRRKLVGRSLQTEMNKLHRLYLRYN